MFGSLRRSPLKEQVKAGITFASVLTLVPLVVTSASAASSQRHLTHHFRNVLHTQPVPDCTWNGAGVAGSLFRYML